MEAIHKERLEKFIEYLKGVPEENFNMSDWQSFREEVSTTAEALVQCGTAACAAGWLALSPDFHAVGGTVCTLTGGPILGDLEESVEAFGEYFGFEDELARSITCDELFYREESLHDVPLSKVIAALEWILKEDPERKIKEYEKRADSIRASYEGEISHLLEQIRAIETKRYNEIVKLDIPPNIMEASKNLFDPY